MKKYYLIILSTIDEYIAYVLNFVMWRVRVILRLLVVYFLWSAIFSGNKTVFGYQQNEILTYILLTPLISSLITGSKSDIGSEIHQGNLANYLLRPLSVFKYWFTKDLADKLLNITFSLIELSVFVLLLKPDLYWQSNLQNLILFVLSLVLSLALYFFLNNSLGFLAFWTADYWGPRFLVLVIQEFLAGGIFPLDILPRPLFIFSLVTPFPYLSYFPLSIYLGKHDLIFISVGMGITCFWIFFFYQLSFRLWHRGLRKFSAEGR